jgi:hypothetical protein
MKVYLKCGICKENVPDLQRFVIPQNFCIQCYEENGEIYNGPVNSDQY